MDSLSPLLTGFVGVLLLTSFVKIFTSLTILRYGIGLEGSGFGIVVGALSLALSLVVVEPELGGTGGLDGVLKLGASSEQGALEKHFRPFIEKQTDPKILDRIKGIVFKVKKGEQQQTPASFSLLTAAFLISELKKAFEVGLMVLIPFIVIDLLVAIALSALAMTQISSAVISLPIKLLLFISVDGWTLISEKLLSGYF